nr:MAG TPA: hypothetical protein [Caudoviricetes sp.]
MRYGWSHAPQYQIAKIDMTILLSWTRLFNSTLLGGIFLSS